MFLNRAVTVDMILDGSVVVLCGDLFKSNGVSDGEGLDVFDVTIPEGYLCFFVVFFNGDGGDKPEFSVILKKRSGGFLVDEHPSDFTRAGCCAWLILCVSRYDFKQPPASQVYLKPSIPLFGVSVDDFDGCPWHDFFVFYQIGISVPED